MRTDEQITLIALTAITALQEIAMTQIPESARKWEVVEHKPAQLPAPQTAMPERPAGYVEPCDRIPPCYVPKAWREYDRKIEQGQ
jgi:hypothetical protein